MSEQGGFSSLCWYTEYEYSKDLNTKLVFEWSKKGWMPNGLVFKCHLNNRQKDTIFSSTGSVFEWLVYFIEQSI